MKQSNERLEEVANLYKMKSAAERKNLLPQARTRMNNKQRPRFDRCVSDYGTVEAGIYRWRPLPGLKDRPIVPVEAKT
jgi:hypothetical protein